MIRVQTQNLLLPSLDGLGADEDQAAQTVKTGAIVFAVAALATVGIAAWLVVKTAQGFR